MEDQTVISSAPVAIQQVLYTGNVHITGGREGSAKSSDGRLDTQLSSPGTKGQGTNPEQLFAAGWSACFIGAMQLTAGKLKLQLPANTSVDTEVDLATGAGGYSLQARLHVNLPGLSFEQARTLVETAHDTCPYSKATRGNINVEISVHIE